MYRPPGRGGIFFSCEPEPEAQENQPSLEPELDVVGLVEEVVERAEWVKDDGAGRGRELYDDAGAGCCWTGCT